MPVPRSPGAPLPGSVCSAALPVAGVPPPPHPTRCHACPRRGGAGRWRRRCRIGLPAAPEVRAPPRPVPGQAGRPDPPPPGRGYLPGPAWAAPLRGWVGVPPPPGTLEWVSGPPPVDAAPGQPPRNHSGLFGFFWGGSAVPPSAPFGASPGSPEPHPPPPNPTEGCGGAPPHLAAGSAAVCPPPPAFPSPGLPASQR